MHVSHLFEDLVAWYRRSPGSRRLGLPPRAAVAPGTLAVKQGPADVQSEAGVVRDYREHRRIGHSGSIQPVSRLQHDVLGPDGVLYEKGTPIPHRADFNTLDNPFFWSADPAADRMHDAAAAGLHFVVFNPTSDDFGRGRLAMDGVLPGRPRAEVRPLARPGLQQRPEDDPPPELPRPAARPPLVPALGAARLKRLNRRRLAR